MKSEVYKGRTLEIVRDTEYGPFQYSVNGVRLGSSQGDEEKTLAWMREMIDFIDLSSETQEGLWGPEWYAPGAVAEREPTRPE